MYRTRYKCTFKFTIYNKHGYGRRVIGPLQRDMNATSLWLKLGTIIGVYNIYISIL